MSENIKKFDDLKYIKDKYGEELSRICRTLFPTILEQPGKLAEILTSTFAVSKSIAKDYENDLDFAKQFKAIIYNKFYKTDEVKKHSYKTAEELFKEAGYTLYPECKTEEDIQGFRHYYYRKDGLKIKYVPDGPIVPFLMPEELCTFSGYRLRTNRIWFAVKDGADKLKREDFKTPKRQDEYGTSVLCLQFTKGENATLSIKNRYNHSVENPDATFSNNLDNIIEGLTEAMEVEYDLDLSTNQQRFEFNNYVLAQDGKYYKYNHEINNIYYCENNIVIENFIPKQLDKFRYILCDYFVIDRSKNCSLSMYDKSDRDSFIDGFKDIQSIQVYSQNNSKNKLIIFKVKTGEDITLGINERNQIISYENSNLKECGDNFLSRNKTLASLKIPNLERCGHWFLNNNERLTSLNLPKLEGCGNNFLISNSISNNVNLINLKQCGDGFLFSNKVLTSINLPNLYKCGDCFFYMSNSLNNIIAPKLEICGHCFCQRNKSLTYLSLPKLKECGDCFFEENEVITTLNMPHLKEYGNRFLNSNKNLINLNSLKLKRDRDFMNKLKENKIEMYK